ncbi:MAG: hypothetical protein QE271_08420 [Bacteriovoracaceae bacterium]|nr:hypothetical protein [Bacteriovoracaceae bacterium]
MQQLKIKTPKIFLKWAHQIQAVLSHKKIIWSAIAASLVGDGSYMIFLYQVFAKPESFRKWIESYKDYAQIGQILETRPEMIESLHHSSLIMFWIMAGVLVGMNGYNYIKFHQGSKRAVNFMKQLGFVGAVLGFLTISEAKEQGSFWMWWMIFMIPLYFGVYLLSLASEKY